MLNSKKIAKIEKFCVACGTCIKECPLNAITITTGVRAKIDWNKCVGCGKCSKICPASAIEIISREVYHEN